MFGSARGGHYGGKPMVLAEGMDFCEALWPTWREVADRHNVSYGPDLMVRGETGAGPGSNERNALVLGQLVDALLAGSPDTIGREVEKTAERVKNAFCCCCKVSTAAARS